MAPQARGGLIVSVVGFFAGIWLFLAPFLVEYQKVGQDWIDATKNDLWTGGALMAISALTLLLFAAFALRDAARAAEQKNTADVEESWKGTRAKLPAVAAVSLFGKLPSVASGEVSGLAEGARLEIA